MATREERDFPAGHPKAADYNPDSPEAKEWRRVNVWAGGERAYDANHPRTLHPEHNEIEWVPGVDPFNPQLQEFTGATPKQVAAVNETREPHSPERLQDLRGKSLAGDREPAA